MQDLHTAVTLAAFDMFAEAATYTPPGGVAEATRVVFMEKSQVMGTSGYVELRPVIHALQSELPRPLIGGVFVVATAGWVIDKPPDSNYGVWQIVVRRAW